MAVIVKVPEMLKTTEQVPVAGGTSGTALESVRLQVDGTPPLILMPTDPVGITPAAAVTVTTIGTDKKGVDGSGASEVMVVTVGPLSTVWVVVPTLPVNTPSLR